MRLERSRECLVLVLKLHLKKKETAFLFIAHLGPPSLDEALDLKAVELAQLEIFLQNVVGQFHQHVAVNHFGAEQLDAGIRNADVPGTNNSVESHRQTLSDKKKSI